jgi:hypothetical protein
MGVVKKHDRPVLYPGHTVWGSVKGPVVMVGDVIRGNERLVGVTVYLDERELNESCLGMWGETYASLRDKLAEAKTLNAELQQEKDQLLRRSRRRSRRPPPRIWWLKPSRS